MNKLLFRSFCIFSLITLLCAVEYEEENFNNRQAYNLNDLFTKTFSRLQNSHGLNDESPYAILDLQLSGIDPDVAFEEFENSLQNSSSKCLSDIIYIILNIKKQWALQVIDSFGKPESGILQGNFRWVGDYDECIQIRSTNPKSTVGNFRGKYCTLTMSPQQLNMSMPFPFSTAICVPDSCSTEELQNVFLFSHVGDVPSLNDTKSPLSVSVTCKPTERHLNGPAKAVIVLLSLFCTLSVLGSSITVVKYFKKIVMETKGLSLLVNVSENEKVVGDGDIKGKSSGIEGEVLLGDQGNSEENAWLAKLETFLGCFCVFTNGAKLLNTDSSEGQLLCIHGIRFLSMSWVILGHTYAFSLSNLRNIREAATLVNNFPFQVVLQGFYSVDSFFVLSGFLLTYLFMKEYAKSKGSMSWPYFYIHRYVRLTPIYMVVLGFYASLYYYIGSGPFWPDGDYDPICRENWWSNLLYINNFKSMSKQCMAWSWYLANDMQFFIISPILLISLFRWPYVGYGILLILLLASWLSNFIITYHYGLSVGMIDLINNPDVLNLGQAMQKFLSYFDKIYIKPYTRIAPYLIGILTGYLLFKHKACNRPKYSLGFLSVGWIVATTITLACVYGLYHSHPTVLVSSFYNALHRTTFALGLCWVIFVCLIGQGGAVNSILSYKLFIPLSRLTYTAYLIHPMLITGYFSTMRTSVQFSHVTMVYTFLGVMLVTYALSLPVALILESPIVSLEKLVRKAFTKKQNN